MNKIIITILLLIGQVYAAEQSNPTIEQLQKQVEKQQHTIKVLKKTLSDKKKQLEKKLRISKRTNKKLQILCKKAGILKNYEGIFIIGDSFTSTAMGSVGYISRQNNFEIVQIPDRNNIIGNIWLKRWVGLPPDEKKVVWVTGVNTTGLVDGGGIVSDRIFFVSGTKSYTTVSGAKATVALIRPLDLNQYKIIALKRKL